MGDYRLPNGRKIGLVRLNMVGTYSGVLEGSKKYASQGFRENLPEMAAKKLPPGHPLAVVGPPKGELPRRTAFTTLGQTSTLGFTSAGS